MDEVVKKLAGALKGQWEQGKPYRDAAVGLFQGNSQPIRQLLNQKSQVNPMTPEQALAFALDWGPMALGTLKLTKSGNVPDALRKQTASLGSLSPEKRFTPSGALPNSQRYDAMGNVLDDMQARIKPLQSGDFLGEYVPRWGSKSKPFYAVGDNADEVVDYLLNRSKKSDKSISAAAKRKAENSLVGKLKKALGDSDDAFEFAKSTQSKSQYITHKPTGTKIRISDHSLPLHYEQPDIDLRTWMSDEEMLERIMEYIK